MNKREHATHSNQEKPPQKQRNEMFKKGQDRIRGILASHWIDTHADVFGQKGGKELSPYILRVLMVPNKSISSGATYNSSKDTKSCYVSRERQTNHSTRSFLFPPVITVLQIHRCVSYLCLTPTTWIPFLKVFSKKASSSAVLIRVNRDLACGLSFLCCGSKSSKLAFAYSLFAGGGGNGARGPVKDGATAARGIDFEEEGEVSRGAIAAFVSGLLTVLCSCVGQMLELTNREVCLRSLLFFGWAPWFSTKFDSYITQHIFVLCVCLCLYVCVCVCL